MASIDGPGWRVLVALFVGLLIGVERERRKAERSVPEFAGLRTFGLAGLLGGVLATLANDGLVITGAVAVAAFSAVAYVTSRSPDRGMTTEVALVLTYALGVLAVTNPLLAGGLAVVVAGVLGMRGVLHRLVRELLSPAELHDAMAFLLLLLVVLPIVPDRGIGPYQALNPAAIARLVVVLTGLSGLGYTAQRWLGARAGMLVAGFVGGFVSSSATIAACSAHARDQPAATRAAAAGALASSVATIVMYGVLVGATDFALLSALALPLLFGLAAALVATGLCVLGSGRHEAVQLARGRAFHLPLLMGTALLASAVSVGGAALKAQLGTKGVVLVSFVSGFVDAHATSGSVATLHGNGELSDEVAVLAIAAALSANTLTKLVMAGVGRQLGFFVRVAGGVLAIAGAVWAGVLATR